jgi:hypothetical protein
MHALGTGLVAARQRRQELLIQIRLDTRALLLAARTKRGEDEIERRKSAARDADARRLFTSELRSEVHALRNRFRLARRDTIMDLRRLAAETNTARQAVQTAPSRKAAAAPRRSAGPVEPAAKTSAHAAPPANGSRKKKLSPKPQPEAAAPPPSRQKRQGTPPPRKRHA